MPNEESVVISSSIIKPPPENPKLGREGSESAVPTSERGAQKSDAKERRVGTAFLTLR